MELKLSPAVCNLCNWIVGIVTLVTTMLCASCGVEPTGWEGGVRVDGQINSRTGEVLSPSIITETTHSQQVTTAADGTFTIFTDPVQGSITLGVLVGEASTESPVTFRVPAERGTATIILQVSGGSVPVVSMVDFIEGEGDATPAPEETPPVGPTTVPGQPTARPRPTQSPPSSPFSSNGDTNSFGIPAGIKGNIGRGSAENKTRCLKCHGERGGGYRFGQLKRSVEGPSMRLKLSQQTLADLTAYLNRGAR